MTSLPVSPSRHIINSYGIVYVGYNGPCLLQESVTILHCKNSEPAQNGGIKRRCICDKS